MTTPALYTKKVQEANKSASCAREIPLEHELEAQPEPSSVSPESDFAEAEPAIGSRELFPDLKAQAYLAHCSISPVSDPVRERTRAVADSYAQYGAKAFEIWLPLRTELRARLGRLFNCSQNAFALLPNTTQGVLTTALCFPWKRGDKIICFRGEFPANVTPWQRAAELYDLEIVYIDLPRETSFYDDNFLLANLKKALAEGARLVAASAVQFQTVDRHPLARRDLVHAVASGVFNAL